MSEFSIRIFAAEGLDAAGHLQSHQYAELPAELTGPYMSGGLKKIRRLAESYFSFRFSAASRRVRSRWHSGEPHLELQFFHLPGLHGKQLAHLGRLRSTGTRDVYRGFMAVRGGAMVSGAARLEQRPWPDDMPWVAPSAGEFIDREKDNATYLGIFEVRVERAGSGCKLHTILADFPPVADGLDARFWDKQWQPMRQAANVDFLKYEVAATARTLGHTVKFEVHEKPGPPERLRFRFDTPAPAAPAR